ncbi:MAG TPA: ABC transporter permease [Anaerolineae bacterium]|nr:ABC transporter permease [Anaerolineae bacterium]HQK15279.1 ABC transporter permease [Anaerolineae bacterium]
MLAYIIQRILRAIPQLFLISILAFIIIQLPPGDIVTYQIQRLRSSGVEVSQTQADALIRQYGMDKPVYMRYLLWISKIITKFDFGYSYTFEKPVAQVILERMGYTFVLALASAIFTYIVAIPIGVFAAVKQYTIADYIITFFTFVGLAVPAFFLAMIIMYIALTKFGIRAGGLFSQEYMVQPWSWGKFLDLLAHLWFPIILLGLGGVAGTIRTMRAMMLDELRKQYVTVARAKGLSEFQVIVRYPMRLAINPIISGLMWLLPWLFSGGTILEIVLNLTTAGPALYASLRQQDMYMAGAYILIIGVLTAISALFSDILLAVSDPRIRFGGVEGV